MAPNSMYMKTFAFALIVATVFGSPYYDYEASSELVRVKTLMNAFLEWAVKEESWEHQKNMMAPNMRNAQLKGASLRANINVTYLIFDNIKKQKQVVDYFRIDPTTLASYFKIRIPSVTETYRYKVAGTILDHKVHGAGRLTYTANNISLAASDLKFHDSPHNIQIASMELMGNIDNLSLQLSGLQVEGMKIQAFERVLQSRVLTLLKERLHYSKAANTETEADLDLLMHDKSLEEIVRWLKQHTKRLTLKNMFQTIFSENEQN